MSDISEHGLTCWYQYLRVELGDTMWHKKDGKCGDMQFSLSLLQLAGGLRLLFLEWEIVS